MRCTSHPRLECTFSSSGFRGPESLPNCARSDPSVVAMRLWIGLLVLALAFEQGRAQAAQGEECVMMQTRQAAQASKAEEQPPGRSMDEPGDDKTISKAAWDKSVESWERAGEVDHVRHGMEFEPALAPDARPFEEEAMKSKIAEVRQAQEEFIRATDMWRRAGEVTKDETH